MNQYFATCPRGLEALLVNELQASGARDINPTDGGVSFSGELGVCYHANLSPTAHREAETAKAHRG